jgi:hypothetical protein
MAPTTWNPDASRDAAEADILRVFALTGRPMPPAADLTMAANTVGSYPKAWRRAQNVGSVLIVLNDYSDALAQIEAQREAA